MKAQGYLSLSQGTMIELMAYVDGELDGEAKERIEKLIATNANARRVVMEMTKLGEVIGEVYEEPPASASAGIADLVMAKIGEEAPAPKKASVRPPKVISLMDARERRIKIGAAIVAAIALAAGIVLTTQHANENMPVAKPERTAAPLVTPAPAPTQEPEQAQVQVQVASAGVDVENVDSPTHEVEVFYLPSTKGNASSVVVWIDDKAGAAP
jgi:anti-sigma factor RsiW